MTVYIVSYQYQTASGEANFENERAFMSEFLATQWMHKRAEEIAKEEYGMTMEELRAESMKEDSMYELEDNHLDVFMMNNQDDSWDKLQVHELRLDGSDTYVDVLFNYNGRTFSERVYMELLDLDHYENVWSWIFGSHTDGYVHDDDIVFELCGDKNADGTPSLTHLHIEVYKDIFALTPYHRFSDIQFRTSWSGNNWFQKA